MPETLPDPMSVYDLVMRSSFIAKGVLLLLLVFSVVSWAIIIHKFFLFKKSRKEDARFLAVFSKSESLNNIHNFARELKCSTLARVFLTGYHELYLFQEQARTNENSGNGDDGRITKLDLKGIELSVNKAVNREVDRLSDKLDFLATTGSTTPFIGLFGTVWGIMHSFRVIGVKGSASIGGVAPGIAEALIATAAGLIAAIPAVIFFNLLNNQIRLFANQMDDFSRDFLYMAEKNFVRKPEMQLTETNLPVE